MSDAERRAAAAANDASRCTLVGLQHDLMARMETMVEAFWYLSTKTTKRKPRVIGGWLPPKSATEDFPFILVRLRSCVDADDGAEATVEIIVGTYSDTDDGYLDVVALLDAIRLDLLGAPIVGEAFEVIGDLKSELDEQQCRPEWGGKVTATLRLARPVRVLPRCDGGLTE